MKGEDNIKILQEMPIFKELSTEEIRNILEYINEEKYYEGEIIFEENDSGDKLYIIKSGGVKIIKIIEEDKEKTLAIFSKGILFGEMAILDNSVRSATAKAIEDTQVFTITRENFEKLIEKNPLTAIKILKGLVRILSQRLRTTNEQISDLVMWGLSKGKT
jgi:CRP/FNR family transcriptional regulator